MFKTQGFWKACQPAAGIIEWTSPGGRTYRTEPHLTLAPAPTLAPVLRGNRPDPVEDRSAADAGPGSSSTDGYTDDYGADPPPF